MSNINLNSIVYNEILTKDEILKYITQEEIYKYYIDTSGPTSKMSSPLRVDNVPSFGLYYHKNGSGTLMFNDLATKDSGDCVVLVSILYGLTYREALLKIVADFNLSDFKISAERVLRAKAPKKIIQKVPIKIGIKSRNWKKHDAKFWSSFGIRKKTLTKFNVIPIEYVFYNDRPVRTDKYAYAYQEFKDDKISYKIYQPYSKSFKWINNANYSVHQGYMQLPDKGELLIITKSLKDVMSLFDVLKIIAIGLQSESVMMKMSVMKEYKKRFSEVICLFDNDTAGKNLSIEFSKKYKVSHFFMPEIEGVTDFSDLVKKVGIEKSKEIFNKCIKNEIK